MLRQVFIYYQSQRIYITHFGKALDEESFASVFKKLQQEAYAKGRDPNTIGSYDFYKYRISFIASPEKEILYVFVTDLTDSVDNIKVQLQMCRREFLELFESVLGSQFDKETFEVFQPTIEKIHKELRPKISLVGFSGVGKTTITRLIRAEEIPVEHVPTITGEIGTIKIGKLSFALWDFAGQEQFSFLWNKFVKGSDAVLLITDSTLENVEKSRFFVELVKQEAPHAHMAIIGNKQDLPGAMPATEIERVLAGVHTYSMVAVDPHNRDKMITIIADILEMSAEVSPLLKPLIERDKKMAMAEESLMNGDFQGAYRLFNEIADLCLELGDDSLSSEFNQKADKVKVYISQMGQPVPDVGKPPASPVKPAGETAAKPIVFEGEETELVSPAPVKSAPPIDTPLKPLAYPPTLAAGKSLLKPGAPPPFMPKSHVQPVSIPKPIPSVEGAPHVKSIIPGSPLPPAEVVPRPAAGVTPPLVFTPPPEDIGTAAEMSEPLPPKPVAQLKVAPSSAPAFIPRPQKVSVPPPITGNPQPATQETPIQPPIDATSAPKVGAPVAPQIKPPAFAQPGPPPEGSGSGNVDVVDTASQKRQTQATLMDLRIKVANMNKFLLEIEMKNLTGEMPDVEFNAKKQRAEQMKSQLERQRAENQDILKSLG